MPKAQITLPRNRRARPPRYSAIAFSIPTLACVFSVVVYPLLLFSSSTISSVAGVMETRYENKLFWPILTAISVILAAFNLARRGKIVWPPHMICLLAYLALAGASVLWSFAPSLSLIRYLQQLMVVTCMVLPAMSATREMDMMRGLFLCFGLAAVLNIPFVMQGYQTFADGVVIGYQGYFSGKNYLGECAALALLLSLHEALYRGRRRLVGIFLAVISLVLIYYSNSKTSLALALLTPSIAGLVLLLRRTLRISPAMVPVVLVCFYFVLTNVSGFNMARLSYMVYGDSSFTGRQTIWDFASAMISLKPFTGWGYQSFWLVGADGPSVVFAPGWVKSMPNAHNGYYDTLLETGYVGFVLLLCFIVATLHGIGRIADREPKRAWILLSLCFFVMIYNGLESTWVRGFEFEWIVFLTVAAEIARYSQPLGILGRSSNRASAGTARAVGANAARGGYPKRENAGRYVGAASRT